MSTNCCAVCVSVCVCVCMPSASLICRKLWFKVQRNITEQSRRAACGPPQVRSCPNLRCLWAQPRQCLARAQRGSGEWYLCSGASSQWRQQRVEARTRPKRSLKQTLRPTSSFLSAAATTSGPLPVATCNHRRRRRRSSELLGDSFDWLRSLALDLCR